MVDFTSEMQVFTNSTTVPGYALECASPVHYASTGGSGKTTFLAYSGQDYDVPKNNQQDNLTYNLPAGSYVCLPDPGKGHAQMFTCLETGSGLVQAFSEQIDDYKLL